MLNDTFRSTTNGEYIKLDKYNDNYYKMNDKLSIMCNYGVYFSYISNSFLCSKYSICTDTYLEICKDCNLKFCECHIDNHTCADTEIKKRSKNINKIKKKLKNERRELKKLLEEKINNNNLNGGKKIIDYKLERCYMCGEINTNKKFSNFKCLICKHLFCVTDWGKHDCYEKIRKNN